MCIWHFIKQMAFLGQRYRHFIPHKACCLIKYTYALHNFLRERDGEYSELNEKKTAVVLLSKGKADRITGSVKQQKKREVNLPSIFGTLDIRLFVILYCSILLNSSIVL